MRFDLSIRISMFGFGIPTTSAHWLMMFTILGGRLLIQAINRFYCACQWKSPFQQCHFQVDCHYVVYFCRDISAWCNIVWVCLVHQTLLYLCKTCIHHSHPSGKPHIHHTSSVSALKVHGALWKQSRNLTVTCQEGIMVYTTRVICKYCVWNYVDLCFLCFCLVTSLLGL